MTGIGIVLFFIGYATVFWGVNAIQGNSQASYGASIFPFAK